MSPVQQQLLCMMKKVLKEYPHALLNTVANLVSCETLAYTATTCVGVHNMLIIITMVAE